MNGKHISIARMGARKWQQASRQSISGWVLPRLEVGRHRERQCRTTVGGRWLRSFRLGRYQPRGPPLFRPNRYDNKWGPASISGCSIYSSTSPDIASGLAQEPGDGWLNVPDPISGSPSITSVTELDSVLEVGDVVRVYKSGNTAELSEDSAGNPIAHSFIVISNDNGNVMVADNWNEVSIEVHPLSDITNSWAPNGQFAAAFVSRINVAVATNPVDVNQTTLQGNGFGNATIWSSFPTVIYTVDQLATKTVVSCLGCGSKLSVPAGKTGTAKCPHCNTTFAVRT